MKNTTFLILSLSSLLPLACAENGGEEPVPAEEIEAVNGGLTMEPEPEMFGEEEIYEALAAEDPEAAVSHPMEADSTVTSLVDRPATGAYVVTIAWGRFPFDPTAEIPRDWSGSISVNRGALLVRSVLRFEDPTDRLMPREDRQVVSFQSVTLPHHDGLRLAVLDPNPASTEPLTLTYLGRDGSTATLDLAEVVRQGVRIEMDETGNRIVAVASRRIADVCNHGFVQGEWRSTEGSRGRLRGRVTTAEGVTIGHVRGIFGVREDGSQVFFGKYIDLSGDFRGLFAGTYGDGHFEGRWMTRIGEHGRIGGIYGERPSTDLEPGRFLGRWQETSCAEAP